jgi:hypothetical protein
MNWETCLHKDECINGCRYGKGCYEDDLNNAMGGKPWGECMCGIDENGNPPTIPNIFNEIAYRIMHEGFEYCFDNDDYGWDNIDDKVFQLLKNDYIRAKIALETYVNSKTDNEGW